MNHLEGLLPILNITPTNYKTGDIILFKKLATLSVLGLTNVAFGDIFFKIPAELLEVNNPPSSMEVEIRKNKTFFWSVTDISADYLSYSLSFQL